MNFFKSVFSDDTDPQNTPPQSPKSQSPTNPNPESSTPKWNFNTLIKTISTKSDTIISTYKRDLVEFQTGLKKETQAITQAIKELPSSLEASASVAHDSLESVWRGTSQIILNTENNNNNNNNILKYNRFELQVHAIRNDVSTYTDDVEDDVDFMKWKLGFQVNENEEEIESLVGENGVMREVYEKVVPSLVDREVFWERYFYRVFKLKQVEDARASLVKRAISGEEEDLSWDVDDDESNNTNTLGVGKDENVVENKQVEELEIRDDGKACVVEPVSESVYNEKVVEGEEKASPSEDGEALKSSELPVVLSGPLVSREEVEEDLGWDEIEDIEGNHDEKKVSVGGSPNRSDLQKRLSGAGEEEDLSWDIEDDDEPVKH